MQFFDNMEPKEQKMYRDNKKNDKDIFEKSGE